MKKIFILSGIMMAMTVTTMACMAETTIYTDGIGRMHFLGKNPGESTQYNYANPEQQDLTRKLYENVPSEVNYVDHPLKDYENTFSDSRFNTNWRKKYEANVDDARVNVDNKVKGSFTAVQGSKQQTGTYLYDTVQNAEESANNVIKNTSEKKHWWNKK